MQEITQEPEVKNEALEKVLQESNLELSESEAIKQSYLPYFNQLAEVKELSRKINFENPTEIDEKIARDLRLKTVKIRTGSEEVKDNRKKIHSLKANLEQSAWNLIKSTCLLEEEAFVQVEKKREIAEKAKKEALRAERSELLSQYTDASIYPLGDMSEEGFNDLLSGLKLAHEAKIEAAKKAEEERLLAIEAEKKRLEDQRIENERLKAEAEEKERLHKEELAKAEALRKEQEEAARRECESQELALKAEREKAEKLRLESEAKAKKEREEQEAKLLAERKEKERLEKEIQDKKDTEIKAQKEKEQADIKAAQAPDKQKLLSLSKLIMAIEMPEMKTVKGKAVSKEIESKRQGFANWIAQQIEVL